MTTDEAWRIGARLLGIYLVVQGGLYATSAVSAAGMGLPEGSNRTMYVLAPVLQALVLITAGGLLVSVNCKTVGSSAVNGDRIVRIHEPLQLLGVYFLVQALSAAARPTVGMMFVGQAWQFRVGDLAAATVETIAGVLLIAWPGAIAKRLERYTGEGV